MYAENKGNAKIELTLPFEMNIDEANSRQTNMMP